MLTGRDTEQQHIDELLRQAAAGGSGVLVLRGDPGIGKTALVDYAARCAGTMRILRATGIEAENELGFAGLYSLLLPVASYLEALPGRAGLGPAGCPRPGRRPGHTGSPGGGRGNPPLC